MYDQHIFQKPCLFQSALACVFFSSPWVEGSPFPRLLMEQKFCTYRMYATEPILFKINCLPSSSEFSSSSQLFPLSLVWPWFPSLGAPSLQKCRRGQRAVGLSRNWMDGVSVRNGNLKKGNASHKAYENMKLHEHCFFFVFFSTSTLCKSIFSTNLQDAFSYVCF